MNTKTEQPEFTLPAEVEEQLDQLLAQWAESYRLTPAQAEVIRQTIVETTEELGLQW